MKSTKLAVVAIAALLGLAGCGKDSSDSSAKEGVSPAVAKKANAVCESWTDDLDKLGPPPQDPATRVQWFDEQIAIDVKHLDELKTVPATEADKKALQPVIDAFDEALKHTKASVVAAKKGDKETAQAERLAEGKAYTSVDGFLKDNKMPACASE